jgi:hypothetical protein
MDFATFDELYGSDEDRSIKGVPVQIGLNRKNEPVTITVAEAGNPNHLKLTRKYEKALESSRHNQEKRRMLNAKIIAESLLIDWSGVLDLDGKPVPATVENKIKAMMHSSRLMSDIIDAASDRANL